MPHTEEAHLHTGYLKIDFCKLYPAELIYFIFNIEYWVSLDDGIGNRNRNVLDLQEVRVLRITGIHRMTAILDGWNASHYGHSGSRDRLLCICWLLQLSDGNGGVGAAACIMCGYGWYVYCISATVCEFVLCEFAMCE